MVTLSSEEGDDKALIKAVVVLGMVIACINRAHDDAAAWSAMAGSERRAARTEGRAVWVLMDLGGSKFCTGEFDGAVGVLQIKPEWDELGRVTAPGRLALHPTGVAGPISPDANQHGSTWRFRRMAIAVSRS